MSKDGGGLLHSDSGPAVVFRDGGRLYYHHGVYVPPYVIESPRSLTAEMLLDEPNTEIRRVMLAKMGIGKFLEEAKAKTIDTDLDQNGNPRRLLESMTGDGIPIRYLHLLDPAKIKRKEAVDVLLQVPPDEMAHKLTEHGELSKTDQRFWKSVGGRISTCQQAVAWSFRQMSDDFHPVCET